MNFFAAILIKIGNHLADRIFDLVKEKLEDYFSTKLKINKISSEAKGLQDELKGANSDQERMAILRKISQFSDSLDNFTE